MKFDIYFHNDFDGCASAAVFLAFLKSRGDRGDLFPVDYKIRPRWEKLKFKRPTAIFDFPYHPRAVFWFDHHPTTFLKKGWQKKYKRSKFHRLNPQYHSCFHLVFDSLVKDFGFKPGAHFREMVRWLDMIDGARFKSAKQTIEKKEPALQISAFIDENVSNRKVLAWIVGLLSEKPIGKIAKEKKVRRVFEKIKKRTDRVLKFYHQNLQVYDKVTFIDLPDSGIPRMRFGPYYFCPDSIYSVTLRKTGRLFRLHLSGNPWRRSQVKVHLGKLLRKMCEGGGHRGAGGCGVRNRKEAERLAWRFIEILRK